MSLLPDLECLRPLALEAWQLELSQSLKSLYVGTILLCSQPFILLGTDCHHPMPVLAVSVRQQVVLPLLQLGLLPAPLQLLQLAAVSSCPLWEAVYWARAVTPRPGSTGSPS